MEKSAKSAPEAAPRRQKLAAALKRNMARRKAAARKQPVAGATKGAPAAHGTDKITAAADVVVHTSSMATDLAAADMPSVGVTVFRVAPRKGGAA